MPDARASHSLLGLGREAQSRSWKCSTIRDIAAKGHLFSEGDSRSHVYKLESGCVCLYRILKDGRRQVIEFAFGGDIVGLGSGSLSSCSAQALAETRVTCLPIPTILTAAKSDPRIALGFYEALSHELLAAHAHLQCVGQRGATEKLAAFLVMLSRRNESRGHPADTIKLTMARVDIADFLGIKTETVSRTLTKMKRQKLIEIDRITTVRLRSISGLMALAEGGSRI
jgi:CRP/FNR family transcriptional regulator